MSEGRVAPKGGRSRESKGSAGRRRRRRRKDEADESDATDRGGSYRRENDESGTTARWHEGCSENRRGTAKGDRKRQTTKEGLGWATASTTLLSLKSLCGGGVPSSHPHPSRARCLFSFFSFSPVSLIVLTRSCSCSAGKDPVLLPPLVWWPFYYFIQTGSDPGACVQH